MDTIDSGSLGWEDDASTPSRRSRVFQALVGAVACIVLFVVAVMITNATAAGVDEGGDGTEVPTEGVLEADEPASGS